MQNITPRDKYVINIWQHFKAGTRQPALTVAGDRSAGLISASWKSKSTAVLTFYTKPKREAQKIKN